MSDTHAVFFWLGGVITQSIEPLLRSALSACGFNEVNLFSLTGFADACEAFALGRQTEDEFFEWICEQLSGLGKPEVNPKKLRDAAFHLLRPNPRVIQVIDTLPSRYQRWLVVDYPHTWFDAACSGLSIFPCFEPGRILHLSESGLERLVPGLFATLPAVSGLERDQCLLIDASSHRAIAAFDHGLPSAIFVDARRLEKEFLLRRFTAQVPLEHRPATVLARINDPQ